MTSNSDTNPEGQSSSPYRAITGVEGLMSSLISPGPGTPGQGAFQAPWLDLQGWSSAFQNNFGGATRDYVQNPHQANYDQIGEEDYTPYEPPPTQAAVQLPNAPHIDPNINTEQAQTQIASGHSVPHVQRPDSAISPKNPATPNNAAAIANAKRLKDLRAQLLAKKTKGSRESSPAAKAKAMPNFVPSQQDAQKVASAQNTSLNGTSAQAQAKAGLSEHTAKQGLLKAPASNVGQASITNGDEITRDLDNLLAEVRKETQNVEVGSAAPDKGHSNENSATPARTTVEAQPSTSMNIPHRPSPSHHISADELSEGEIRSDDEPTVTPKSTILPKKPEQPEEPSLDSEEKSRRESEVEAAYKRPAAPSRRSQEKLRRQSQVDFAYSPLRKSSATSGKDGRPPLDTSAVHHKLSNLTHVDTPKSTIESPSNPWVTQPKPRAAEYDLYIPPGRKPSLTDRHIENGSFTSGRRPAAGDRANPEDRQRAIAQKEKAAKEYKRMLASRPQTGRVISHTGTTYMGRVGDEKADIGSSSINTHDVPLETTQVNADTDLADWLELTEYHDEEYRMRKLARFRKKKELDMMRLQLEEEEKQELEQRSLFRSTGLTKEPTPQITKMPPPPLVLRENPTDGTANITALAAETQVATPTLKRQHAEPDTDARTKIARVATNQSRRPSIKDETSPTSTNHLPFEDRVSRDDAHVGSRYRPRSRSPERYRHRSASPDFRPYSVPDAGQKRVCHNCGEPGHYQTTCIVPRRDGRDRYRAAQLKPRNFEGVSPNYLGKKPRPGFKDPRAVGYSSVNRSIDDDNKRP